MFDVFDLTASVLPSFTPDLNIMLSLKMLRHLPFYYLRMVNFWCWKILTSGVCTSLGELLNIILCWTKVRKFSSTVSSFKLLIVLQRDCTIQVPSSSLFDTIAEIRLNEIFSWHFCITYFQSWSKIQQSSVHLDRRKVGRNFFQL